MKTQSSSEYRWAFAIALLTLAGGLQAKTIHVNAIGTGDFPSIRAAVAAAQSGDIILLDQGIYVGTNNVNITFSDRTLTLCGREPNNPDVVAKTVIDCRGSSKAMCYALGVSSSTSDMDSSSSAPASVAHLALVGLTIRSGYDAAAGSAVRCEDANLDATNCVFDNNRSQMMGGAIYCQNSHARFTGCTFSSNASDSQLGGAVHSTGSQLDFVSCLFRDNSGCALLAYDSQLTLTDCILQNNRGPEGGAIYSRADLRPEATSLILTGCTFTANSATGSGGALCNYGGRVSISICIFKTNTASMDGGAMYNNSVSPATVSCLFVGNTAVGTGGAVQNVMRSSPTLLNDTFVANRAARGGAVAAQGNSNPLLSHCILWGNAAGQGPGVYLGEDPLSVPPTATAMVKFCDVEGGQGGIHVEPDCTLTWDAVSNLSSDPLFVAGDTGDYRLSPDSPCINAGDPAYTPKTSQTDLDGMARRLGSAVDLGAYEFQGIGPVYRLWSPTSGIHFYTISTKERDGLLKQVPNPWQLESVAFYAYYSPVRANLLPVYRFVANKVGSRFYTISEDERKHVLQTWPNVWTYESIAFYAYAAGRQPFGTLPVYRFWSAALGSHFYTMDEDEKDRTLRDYPTIWSFEGVAWYAYPKPHPPANAAYAFTGGSQEAWYTITLSATVDGKDAQISMPSVTLPSSSTWMQMTLDFDRQATTLDGLRVQTGSIQPKATITLPSAGLSIPLVLSLQASFEASTLQGPYPIDPNTGVFANFAKNGQSLVVKDPGFTYSGSAQFSGQSKSFNLQAAANWLELSASGTFEAINLLPDEIDARMPFTFQWHRHGVKDLLAQASVNGHTVQLYVTNADVSTQGLWKGKLEP